VELGKQVPGPVAIVLVARGAAAMEDVKKAVLQVGSFNVTNAFAVTEYLGTTAFV
jgi:hypothetical protein